MRYGGAVPLQIGGAVIQAPRSTSVNVSVTVPVNASSSQAVSSGPAESASLEQRIQARFARSKEFHDLVSGIVAAEVEARPSLRAAVRGDRV